MGGPRVKLRRLECTRSELERQAHFLQRLLLRPRKTAEYCDEPLSLSLSLSVLSHSSKSTLLTLLLTLCGLTSRKTHRGGLGLSGSVHKGAQPV